MSMARKNCHFRLYDNLIITEQYAKMSRKMFREASRM